MKLKSFFCYRCSTVSTMLARLLDLSKWLSIGGRPAPFVLTTSAPLSSCSANHTTKRQRMWPSRPVLNNRLKHVNNQLRHVQRHDLSSLARHLCGLQNDLYHVPDDRTAALSPRRTSPAFRALGLVAQTLPSNRQPANNCKDVKVQTRDATNQSMKTPAVLGSMTSKCLLRRSDVTDSVCPTFASYHHHHLHQSRTVIFKGNIVIVVRR